MCRSCDVRWCCQRAAITLSILKRRWVPGGMQSLNKMFWIARRITIFLGKGVSHGGTPWIRASAQKCTRHTRRSRRRRPICMVHILIVKCFCRQYEMHGEHTSEIWSLCPPVADVSDGFETCGSRCFRWRRGEKHHTCEHHVVNFFASQRHGRLRHAPCAMDTAPLHPS